MSLEFWFDPESLRALCDDGVWARGSALFKSGAVRRLAISPKDDHWSLKGDVQGSQLGPYQLTISLALMPDGAVDYWRSNCSCPVGLQCKHGVALIHQAARQGPSEADLARGLAVPPAGLTRPPTRGDAQQRMAEVNRLEAEARLVNWLLALDKAGGFADGDAPGGHGPGTSGAADRPEQYVYLLSVVGAPRAAPMLQLEAVVSYPKVTGGWAKPKLVRTQPGKGQAVFDRASDTDRQVLQLLRALPRHQNYYSAYSGAPCAVLEGQIGLLAVQQAASTGRLFADAGGSTVGVPLQWGEPLPMDWHWQAVPGGRGEDSHWALSARLPGAATALCHNSPPMYLDAVAGLCGPAHAPGMEAAQLQVLLQAPPLSAAALQKYQAEVARHLGPLPLPPVLQGLARLDGVAPVARLHLSPTPAAGVAYMGLITAQLRFDYQGHVGWWAGQNLSVLVDDLAGGEGKVLLQRDGRAEIEAVSRLMELGLLGVDEGLFGIPGERPQGAWMLWADEGFAALRGAGFALTVAPELDGWITHAQAIHVHLGPEGQGGDGDDGGGDAFGLDDDGGAGADAAAQGAWAEGAEPAPSPWFELSLGIEIDGQRHNILPWLPDLIAAATAAPAHPADPDGAAGSLPPYLYLPSPGGHGFVRLPTDTLRPWLAALLDLAGDRAHDFSGESLRLSRLEALRTSASLGEGAVWEGAGSLHALVRQLQGQGGLPEVPVPAGVHAQLRPYQQQGLNWLQFLRANGLAGVLADDMGLGKTLQTLAHIQVEKDAGRLVHPVLIVAPVSLMGNWEREAARFTPGLRSVVLHGKERHALAESMAEHDLVIAPYSLLQRDRERWLEARWHMVVLDEAQNIKNATTNAAQVVAQLQANHRLCLSGTPMENHLGEIWSLFHFLMPGFLGSQQRFRDLFRNPIERQGNTERLAQLRARITPFMLRRAKSVVAHELPPKIETVMPVELSGAQADLYETIRLGMEKTVREALHAKGLARSQITILDALLKLRQVCCDPQLVPLEAARKVHTSAKLAQLMEMLPEMLAEGRRILLFSQFTSMLALIEAELSKHGLPWVKLTGQSQKRDAIIDRFTSGEVPLFLISLKAGGVGLNLPQADTVIHYDPWWNPAVEAQATDRAHRIGQTQSVWVVKLVARGTIEERILALQEKKAQLAESLYQGAAERKQPLFTESDLAELLQPLSLP